MRCADSRSLQIPGKVFRVVFDVSLQGMWADAIVCCWDVGYVYW